jgi:CRISPR-associated protein Cas2
MRILVCYDVSTGNREGEKRLRKMARLCVDFGQRVQKSVFECVVTDAQLEKFRQRMLAILKPDEDSLRLYRLPADLENTREIHGLRGDIDFEGPLVV